MILILTGQPHSGKTTISNHLKNVFEASKSSRKVYQIDGDDLREILNNKDYSEQGRRKNIETAHAIAKYLENKDMNNLIILSLVSPFMDLREELKANYNAIEFYIHTTEVRGRENFHVANYEAPYEDFIDIDTNEDEVTTINEILNTLNKKQNG
jgi:adenylylsulfate kinase